MTKHCCRNCHFLTKTTSAYDTQTWDKEDRALCWPEGKRDRAYLANIPEENRRYYKVYKVGCYKNEWERNSDELVGGSSRQSLKKEILSNRKGQCFFVEYRAGEKCPEAEKRFLASREAGHQKSVLFWTIAAVVATVLIGAITISLQMFGQGNAP